jgi:hypothetical protein
VANAPVIAIIASADGVPVTSKKIFRSATGIFANTSIAAIQGNSITDSTIGIDFVCTAGPNVHSNIIMDAGEALFRVLPTIATQRIHISTWVQFALAVAEFAASAASAGKIWVIACCRLAVVATI